MDIWPTSSQKLHESHDLEMASELGNDEFQGNAPWRALFFFTTRSHISLFVLGVAASTIAGAASPATYLVVGKLLTCFVSFGAGVTTNDKFMSDTTRCILYLVAISAASWVFHSLEFTIWLAFGELQAKSARDRLFQGLLKKEMAWYDLRKHGMAALLPRIQTQIRELQLATAQPLGSLVCMISTSVLSLVQALVKSWDLTLVTLSTVPVIISLAVFVGRGVQINLNKHEEKLTEAQKSASNAFTAIETVKCYNGQSVELAKYREFVEAASSYYARVANAAALQMGLVTFLAQCMFVQGFYYGGTLVARGHISAGDVVTTFFSALTAFQSLEGILPQMIVFEKGRSAGSTLRAVMAQIQSSSSNSSTRRALQPISCVGSIDVRNVSFAYPTRPDQRIIKDVTLHIQGGGLTFLVGQSGSGKSTISQLLLRFYECSGGEIRIDGTLSQDLEPQWLRSNITLVEQTSVLFDDTVYRNIALGRKNYECVTKADVMNAAEFALLQLMINDMPDGLETQVGLKGSALSGGQRQRIALARARLRDTPILILDESTSALDQISRTLMMEAIRQWREDRTTIVITHDISQILHNDYVYLLENGEVVQEGRREHIELAKEPRFQRFCSAEQLSETSGSDENKLCRSDSDTMASEDSSPNRNSSEYKLDPLEMALTMNKDRVSKFTTPMIGVGIKGPVPSSSTWVRLVGSPVLDRDSSSAKAPAPINAISTAMHTVEYSEPSTRPLSQALEKFVEQTGKFAAEARLKARRTVKPRNSREDSMEIPLTSVCKSLENPTASWEAPRFNSLKYTFRTVGPSLSRCSKIYLLMGFWGATVHAAAPPAFSYLLNLVFETYSVPGGDQEKALRYALIILAIAAVNGLHTWLFRFLHEYTSELWTSRIKRDAFEHIMDQSRDFFEHEENNIFILTENLDRNAEEMRNLLGRFASLAYVVFVMVMVSLLWAMSAQWKMTLICLALAPFIFSLTKAYADISERWESQCNDASEIAASIFTETFTNIKSVRALTLETYFLEKYSKATQDTLRVGFQRALYAGFFYGLSDSAGNFGMVVVFYVGAKLAEGGARVKDVIMVLTMLIFLISSVTGILGFIPQIGSSKDAAARLLRLARLPRDSHEHLGDTIITSVGDIVFDELTFSYPRRAELTVLKGINLRIPLGTTIAIVGSSGSGKSTIANLLLDLYSTASLPGRHNGDLTIGGRDMKHLLTSSLRALIVPVSQTPTLFAASVAENITYGLPLDSPDRTAQCIESAARQAGIHDFILSLPSGYDTLIGDGGMGLSGGQSQRIAIARALVRHPSVLILDEATSALDVESANLVRRTIRELIDNRQRAMTVIIITHHRDMMEMAERIVVLDRGSIAEEGRFAELLAKHGALANMLGGGVWNGDRRKERKQASGSDHAPLLKEVKWKKPY